MTVLSIGSGNGDLLPQSYTEEEIRHTDLPEIRYLIPDLLPIGLTICAAPPKSGKTFFGQQIEHYLAACQPFLRYEPREDSIRCLVIDLEGSAHITKKRSWLLAKNGDFSRIEYRHEIPGAYAAERFAWLDRTLADARDEGNPYGYVRIDTLRLFLGPNPGHRNAYDVDNANARWLNQLALSHGIAIFANTHLTKGSAGGDDWVERVTGSAGGPGGATGIWLLERTRGSHEGVLQTTSRDAEETEWAMRFETGRWSLAGDITPDQARRTGLPRLIMDHLTTHGPTDRATLNTLADENHVGVTLQRLATDGNICYSGVARKWHLPGDTRHALFNLSDRSNSASGGYSPPAPGPPTDNHGQAVTAEGKPERLPDTSPALKMLKDAIGTVETRPCRPIPLISKQARTEEPWSLIAGDGTHLSSGRHAWRHGELESLPDDAPVLVLDRRASYPSAMSSVPVAPNKLIHTGSNPDPDRAGVYLIHGIGRGPEGIGHPLGVDADSMFCEPRWMTTPAIRQLSKLGFPHEIINSYTGKAVSNLFEDYYKWVRYRRSAWAGTPEELAEFKRETSIAIRLIWPKSHESGLWRPDWHNSIHAEANIRHWAKANRAVQRGDRLLAMVNTDETVWLIPDGADSSWLPSGYSEGPSFGQVSVKARTTLGEWRKKRGAR